MIVIVMMIAIVAENVIVMNSFDFNEYRDLELIKNYDGFITPQLTFYRVRHKDEEDTYFSSHKGWAEAYIREFDLIDLYKNGDYHNCASNFLIQEFKWIRFSNFEMIIYGESGYNLWEVYKDYVNGEYSLGQIEFLKTICEINAVNQKSK